MQVIHQANCLPIDFLETLCSNRNNSGKACGGFVAVAGPDTPQEIMDLPLSGTSSRHGELQVSLLNQMLARKPFLLYNRRQVNKVRLWELFLSARIDQNNRVTRSGSCRLLQNSGGTRIRQAQYLYWLAMSLRSCFSVSIKWKCVYLNLLPSGRQRNVYGSARLRRPSVRRWFIRGVRGYSWFVCSY